MAKGLGSYEHVLYVPPPTIRKFMLDDSFARFVVGPLGSGKSAGMIFELLRRSLEQRPDAKGIRPTRWAIIRNTLPQIRQTCLADIKEWLGPIADYKVYESTVYFNVPLSDGTRMQSEWLLLPIDTEEDTRRLLSLQLTGAWASEFRELPYSVISAAMGRCGRYPRARVDPTWYGLIGESNPFSDGSDWHEHLEIALPKSWKFWRQPGGLDPLAENRDLNPNTGRPKLPVNYYENLMEGHDEEWVRVHVHAQNGDDLQGQAVFRRSFIEKYHVSDEPLQVDRRRPLMVCQDLGRTPAALICQDNPFGGLVVFREITSVDHGLQQFITDLLMPVLRTDRFANCPVYAVCDPSGMHKSQLREENAADIFKLAANIPCYGASTNDIEIRKGAVEKLLLGFRGGKPGIVIDREGCPLLVQAMKSKYRYRRRRTGELEDRPDKNHPWSDLADDLQYGALSVMLNLTGRYIQASTPVKVPPPVPSLAWT